MPISTPAKRYATALFHAAEDAKATATLQAQATTLHAALQGQGAASLATPLTRTQRTQLAAALIKTIKPQALLANTISLLAENNRLGLLPEVLESFAQQANTAAGILSADVQSVAPLSAEQEKALKAQLKAATKAKDVTLATTLRPNLVGGFRVFYSSKVWDESVRGHLEALKERLRSSLSAHQKANF